jgi:tellurium resistance protein TerZ
MAVNLRKGQKISLRKKEGGSLTKVTMGLGWDVAKGKGFFGRLLSSGSVDLDASCVMFDGDGQIADSVWFRQLKSNDGSVIHTGDNTTGAGDGDDEQIVVQLSAVPGNIATLMFVVNSFTGQNFSKVANAYCRLVDATTNKEVARFDLSCQGDHTGQIMAKVHRAEGEWQMQAIGTNAVGQTFNDMLPALREHL